MKPFNLNRVAYALSLFSLFAVLTLFLGTVSAYADEPSAGTYSVRSYGAVGDGQTKDTIAIQKAIDACTQNGGGTVVVPPGTYLSGSLFLKNNVDFQLMAGAMIQASPDKEDYNAADVCPQNYANPRESSSGAHLFLCIEQKNVSLRGPGRIDGASLKFIVDEKGTPYPGQDKIPWRPSQMLYFVESDNIRVQDIELTNSSYWTSFYHGCTHVFIRGVKIQNSRNPHTHNGDGIDIDCCEYVSISDCQINSADDCITLRANSSRLKTPRPCRYVTVNNCILSTPCNCFRFGVGNGLVEFVTIDNIVIESARTAFNFVSSWSETSRGVDMRNIRINNITADCAVLLHMYYNFAKETEIRDIAITGVTGTLRQVAHMDPLRRDKDCVWLNQYAPAAINMVGRSENPIKEIRFADIQLKVFPKAIWHGEYIDGLSMENVVFQSVNPEQPTQYDLIHVSNFFSAGRNVPEPNIKTDPLQK